MESTFPLEREKVRKKNPLVKDKDKNVIYNELTNNIGYLLCGRLNFASY
jgi:hypothetical protein